jgi:hypothetical protein
MLDMGDGEAWLEGLRVHPSDQSQGIGSHLHDYFLDRWLASGLTTVRLATHLDREAVHAMCRRTGFEQVFTAVLAHAGPLHEGPTSLRASEFTSQEARLLSFADSPMTRAQAGLVDYGWRFASLSMERLIRMRDLVHLVHEEGGGQALVQAGSEAHVVALACETGSLRPLANALRRWLAEEGYEKLDWLAPAKGAYRQLAESAGYKIDRSQSLMIYERRR